MQGCYDGSNIGSKSAINTNTTYSAGTNIDISNVSATSLQDPLAIDSLVLVIQRK